MTWNSGVRPRLALRLQLLDQLLERQVLVGLGGERPRSRTRRASSRKAGSPASGVRSTRVLTKRPIMPSGLGPAAAGHGHADAEVVLAGEAGEQRREAGRGGP